VNVSGASRDAITISCVLVRSVWLHVGGIHRHTHGLGNQIHSQNRAAFSARERVLSANHVGVCAGLSLPNTVD
jgi:hypothetical protein